MIGEKLWISPSIFDPRPICWRCEWLKARGVKPRFSMAGTFQSLDRVQREAFSTHELVMSEVKTLPVKRDRKVCSTRIPNPHKIEAYIFGEIDELRLGDNGEYYLHDFKTSTLNDDDLQLYSGQQSCYMYALLHPDRKAEPIEVRHSFLTVLSIDEGVIVPDSTEFLTKFHFRFVKLESSAERGLELATEYIDFVAQKEPPPPLEDCVSCNYAKRRKRVMDATKEAREKTTA